MTTWVTLSTRFGQSQGDPSNENLKSALSELFSSNDPEHPDAWIECGSDDGPLETISIYDSGYALYTKYSDADMSDKLENKRIENINENSGFEIWKNLISSTKV